MGTSRSGADLSKKLQGYAKEAGKANRQAVSAAAMQYKDELLDAAERDLDTRNPSPKRSFSRWGKDSKGMAGSRKALQVGAGYDLRGYVNATAKLKARPQGPWKVLEYGAKDHNIIPGLTRTKARNAEAFGALFGLENDTATLARAARGVRGRVRPLRIPGSPTGYAMFARVKGSKAKKTWSRSLSRRTPAATRAFSNSHRRSLVRAMSR
jgi:hypothetical protein